MLMAQLTLVNIKIIMRYQCSFVSLLLVWSWFLFIFFLGFLTIHGSAVIASVGGFNYAFHVPVHIDTV